MKIKLAILSIPIALLLHTSPSFAQTIEDIQNGSTTQPTSTSSSTIREKVKEKLDAKLRYPQAYLGTITDITQNTYELKSENSEIILVQFDTEQTTYSRIGKTSKSITSQDIAIADYVIAMGYVNTNSVLEATRILVSDPIKSSSRTAIYGQVKQIENSSMTIQTPDNTTYTIIPNRFTDITIKTSQGIQNLPLTEINTGDKTIIAGELDSTTLQARTIQIQQQ